MLSLPFATVMGIITNTESRDWNERMLDKWGIAFVGLAFTVCLASWLARRETKAEARRQVREDKLEETRQEREEAASAERLAMQTEIRDLNRQQLEQAAAHAKKLEQLTRDGNKAQADVGMELKNIARKIRCPGQTS
jgi:Flp pilus assembly protein TadB